MQTEIEKRIERDCYGYENLEDVLVGAKFILELPELREAVETLSEYASENNWAYGRFKNLGKYIPINGLALPNGFNKAQEALSKLRSLGIVKDGGE